MANPIADYPINNEVLAVDPWTRKIANAMDAGSGFREDLPLADIFSIISTASSVSIY